MSAAIRYNKQPDKHKVQCYHNETLSKPKNDQLML